MNEVQSKRFKLNQEDTKKILTGACIAMGGALLTYLTQVIGETDFGDLTPLITAIAAILINAGRKALQGAKE